MKHLIVKVLINAAALMFTSNLIDGIYVDGFGSVLVAAIILGIVNAIIRPLLLVLTLPLNVLTMGLINIVGALVLSVVSTVLNWLVD